MQITNLSGPTKTERKRERENKRKTKRERERFVARGSELVWVV